MAFVQKLLGFHRARFISSLPRHHPWITVQSPLQSFQRKMTTDSGAQPSTSKQPWELPENVPHIPGITYPHLCILDAFRTSIAQRMVEAYPELSLEKVTSMRSELCGLLSSL